ncbi:MAG: molybdopterin converting factor, subunit 1 [Phycisphaerales bacterium]|nr:molybdopterin converting factor, subunit 1 [Phycisphaerales bacterium]
MKVLFLNNEGAGFAEAVDVAAGTTVSAFFAKQLPDRKTSDFLIRVNRLPVPADQVLAEGDRVTMTPTKIDGAAVTRPASSVVMV